MASKTYEANLNGQGLRFGVVVGRFNSLITERLLEGAYEAIIPRAVGDEEFGRGHRDASMSVDSARAAPSTEHGRSLSNLQMPANPWAPGAVPFA